MANKSLIEWTGDTANVFYAISLENGRRGWVCVKVSPGCAFCYAEVKNLGFFAYGTGLPYVESSLEKVKLCFDRDLAQKWARHRLPRPIFINSMTDTFGEFIPDEWVFELLDHMVRASQHTFQVLTKRAERMCTLVLGWLKLRNLERVPSHIHLVVSVENNAFAEARIPWLLKIPCVRGLSVEPLLGPISNLIKGDLHWVIVGGESGGKARAMEAEWVRDIRDQCLRAGVPFFFKQWGKTPNNPDPTDPTDKRNGGKAKGGRMLDDRTWDEMPR